MVPNPSSDKDTSYSRLARPRRRAGSVRQRDTEFLKRMLGGSLTVSADLQRFDPVGSTTDGGRESRAISNLNRSGQVPVELHRIDAPHGSLPRHGPRAKQDQGNAGPGDSVAPRRRPSFGSLLQRDTSRSHAQSGTGLNEECRHDLSATSLAYDRGTFRDSEFMQDPDVVHEESEGSAAGRALSSSNDGSGSQQVGGDSSDCSRQIDRQKATTGCEFGAGASVGAEDWLSLHAADLIRRIQSWADELSARESQFTTRLSLQEQRERSFRARCEKLAARAEKNTRHGH